MKREITKWFRQLCEVCLLYDSPRCRRWQSTTYCQIFICAENKQFQCKLHMWVWPDMHFT